MNGSEGKRRLACENSRFYVYFDNVQRVGQPAVKDYLVVAPKIAGDNLVTGVAVLPIVDGRIGLLRVYRHAVRCESWEIPRGFVEPGDDDHSGSALRELREETGLACARDQMRSLGFVTPDAGVLAARVHIFAALHCDRVEHYQSQEIGHREFRLFNSQAVDALVSRGEIQDPCSLIAYYKLFQCHPA